MSRFVDQHREELLDRVMAAFWEYGFAASIDTIVASTGTTRHTLYKQFGGKHGLFETVLDRYSATVVSGAMVALATGATPSERVLNYFEFLISAAQRRRTLAWGCLMANTMAEVGTTHREISSRVRTHFARICEGVERVYLEAGCEASTAKTYADVVATHAQGIWLRARAGATAAQLRAAVRGLLAALPLGFDIASSCNET